MWMQPAAVIDVGAAAGIIVVTAAAVAVGTGVDANVGIAAVTKLDVRAASGKLCANC